MKLFIKIFLFFSMIFDRFYIIGLLMVSQLDGLFWKLAGSMVILFGLVVSGILVSINPDLYKPGKSNQRSV